MKKFIDDISVLAAEQCLISQLPSFFLSESILDFSDDELIRMANESDSASQERARCAEKLAVLEDGKSDLKRLESHRVLSPSKSRVDNSSRFASSLWVKVNIANDKSRRCRTRGD